MAKVRRLIEAGNIAEAKSILYCDYKDELEYWDREPDLLCLLGIIASDVIDAENFFKRGKEESEDAARYSIF